MGILNEAEEIRIGYIAARPSQQAGRPQANDLYSETMEEMAKVAVDLVGMFKNEDFDYHADANTVSKYNLPNNMILKPLRGKSGYLNVQIKDRIKAIGRDEFIEMLRVTNPYLLQTEYGGVKREVPVEGAARVIPEMAWYCNLDGKLVKLFNYDHGWKPTVNMHPLILAYMANPTQRPTIAVATFQIFEDRKSHTRPKEPRELRDYFQSSMPDLQAILEAAQVVGVTTIEPVRKELARIAGKLYDLGNSS